MAEYSSEKIELITKICVDYYLENMNQQAIARKYNISRPQISKYLTYAKQKGIVQVSIKQQNSEDFKLEMELTRMFKLQDAIVVNTQYGNPTATMALMGKESTKLLNRYLHNGSVVAVSSGSTLYYVTQNFEPITASNITVVPVTGNLSDRLETYTASKSVENIARKWDCIPYQLNITTIVSNPEAKAILLKEKNIKTVLDIGKNADIFLSGAGNFDASGTLMKDGYLTKKEVQELLRKKATASFFNLYFDKEGNQIDFSGEDRMIGVSIKEIKKDARIVLYSFGMDKVNSISSVLKSGYVNILVTDSQTASEIIKNNT